MVTKKDLDFLTLVLELNKNNNEYIQSNKIREHSEDLDKVVDLKQSDVRYRARKFGDGKHFNVNGRNWLEVFEPKNRNKKLSEKDPLELKVVKPDEIRDFIKENDYEEITFGDIKEEIKIVRKENEDLKSRMKAILLSVDEVVDSDEEFIREYKEQLSEIEEGS